MESEPGSQRLPLLDRYFHYLEVRKPSDRLLLFAAILVFIGALSYTLLEFNNTYKTVVATRGGILTEGIVGTPRFVNPVLAITRADQDVAALVYSGLMRITPEGTLEPELAESITVSDDGLVYNITLREGIYFHDGTPVTAEDVAFTIGLIQDPMLKSPLRGNWNDVIIELIGERELNIVLTEPYAPFIENLTVGILPKHIWGELSIEQLPFSQHNTDPIGSGPYQVQSTDHNNSGLIESYTLRAAKQGERTAKIDTIELIFFSTEKELVAAFDEGAITNTASLPIAALGHIDQDEFRVVEQPLPRVFSVFFNQNRSVSLRDKSVRQALGAAIDSERLIETVLNGRGVSTNSPIPAGFLPVKSGSSTSLETALTGVRYAETLLIDGGWEQQEDGTWEKEIDGSPVTLRVTITTSNDEVFEATANFIKTAWEELGVGVQVELFQQSDLVQASIRPRNYEALLFGTETGRSLDLYPFWHSSQKDDPGLNVAQYTSISGDDLLETARISQGGNERNEALWAFEAEVMNEVPAIFLYSPAFTYVLSSDIATVPMERIVRPSERFSNVREWYMSESDVWPIFAD